MQENISVTDSYSTGNAAQAMLEKLLQIYDVKTLVAQLNGVGENHWSAAILKRALANDSAWHHLSEKEFAHLQTLLPKPPAHHPHYAFRFIDLFAGIGGIRRGFESIGGQCVFTSEWNKHAVRTYKANHYCDPATHHFNEDIRDITLSHKEGVSDEAAAEHIRNTFLNTMFYWPVSLVSHFRWLAYRKRTRSGGRTVLPAILRARCSLMWCALSTRVVRRCLCSKTSKT
ncbi:C-5 cytosine-specific DNA methylase family protein [Escherichia coli 2-210-07_S1_C3]|nr:C-5 cytosine-specific DNA methylase family protein [Escherichia coli 2-210-07_S1_C3]